MTQLNAWAGSLRSRLTVEGAPEIVAREEHVEAVVCNERAARKLRTAAQVLGILSGALRITRPLTFLEPYLGGMSGMLTRTTPFLPENVRQVTADSAVLLTGLPPVVGKGAQTLVLGSMPGELSLERGEYYANPRNRFWTVMEEIVSVPRNAAYADRVEALESAGIALSDVLKHCSRLGSLDSAIDSDTEVPNDFEVLLGSHPSIKRIVLNGQKAARSFDRHVAPGLNTELVSRVVITAAPSTSPANTRVTLVALVEAWRKALA